MILSYIGEAKAAKRVEGAVRKVIQKGDVLTPDLGGKARTMEMAEAIVGELQ